MKPILLIIALTTLFYTSNGQPCPCSNYNYILQCSVTNSPATLNTNGCGSFSSINVVYTGNVILSLTASSTQPIVIQPVDGSGNNVLQISGLNTNAAAINIQITLSSNQIGTILIPASSSINAPGNLTINVIQTIANAGAFKIFDTSYSPTQTNFANYILTFNTTSASAGNLSLPDLIYGLQNLTSIKISGNNHTLVVNGAKMPSSINVNQLTLKNLILSDQILIRFYNLQTYVIKACQYSKTSSFLNSTQRYNLSLTMMNNIPLDSTLPFRGSTFAQLGKLTTLIVTEPLLNSSFLQEIQEMAYPKTLIINLGNYYQSDMTAWAQYKPDIWYLTIDNIKDLSIFPPLFFYNFQAIYRVILQGSFDLEKSDICIFTAMNIQLNAVYPIVVMYSSTNNTPDDCAVTYITAINTYSTNNIYCSPNNTRADCQRWASATSQCDLVTYENTCAGTVTRYSNSFFYNGSYLYYFLTQSLWLNTTGYNPEPPISNAGSVNIGAIIGAICGLVAAIALLIMTIYCIYRHRQKDSTNYVVTTPADRYKASAHDPTHVSIATSKSSKSSRYALEQTFFPVVQPTDEIAPPLYTAPSESVGSVSAYNLPSAPPAPRRTSASTQATHVYETLDS